MGIQWVFEQLSAKLSERVPKVCFYKFQTTSQHRYTSVICVSITVWTSNPYLHSFIHLPKYTFRPQNLILLIYLFSNHFFPVFLYIR